MKLVNELIDLIYSPHRSFLILHGLQNLADFILCFEWNTLFLSMSLLPILFWSTIDQYIWLLKNNFFVEVYIQNIAYGLELISDILRWTPSHGQAKVGRPPRTYIQQLCVETGCSLEDSREWWTIETTGERRSGRSMLAAPYDDDDYQNVRSILNHGESDATYCYKRNAIWHLFWF